MLVLTENLKKLLMIAFLNESKARNDYSFFAEIAKKEGFENIAQTFLKLAEQEKEHAKVFFNFLKGQGDIKIEQNFTIPAVENTLHNLKNAYENELKEYNEWYPSCAKIAYEEGFEDITSAFVNIANAENFHAETLKALIDKMENNSMFKSGSKKKMWRCECCGCHSLGDTPPDFCPICGKSKDFFSQIESLE